MFDTQRKDSCIRKILAIGLFSPLITASFSVFADATFNSVSTDVAIQSQYIVVLKDTSVNDSMSDISDNGDQLITSGDAITIRKQIIENISEEIASKHQADLLHQYSSVVSGFSVSMDASKLKELLKDDRIAYIEQDQIIRANTTQKDTTWGLDRIDQQDLPLNNEYKYNYSGKGVTAYVVDSGIYASHPDFDGRVSNGADFINDGNGTADCSGHGTHVAGIIGSKTYGIAKDVALIPVRVLDCDGDGFVSGAVAGLDWVLENVSGPSVVNISLSGGSSSAYEAAINALVDENVTVVASAGNDDDDACNYAPANIPDVVTVAASNSFDVRASFSNYGDCVDFFAPGELIISTYLDNEMIHMSGTSMAAPHVAGIVALYLEKNPTAHPYDIQDELETQAAKDRIADTLNSPNLLVQTQFSEKTSSVMLSIEDASDHGESDGSYPAKNVIDGSLTWESRWEAIVLPANLELDLGTIQNVTDIGISFGKGGDFKYGFEVWARATTNHAWTKVLNQTNTSGKTSSIESYDITDIDAQYIRIKTRSNTGDTDVTIIKEVELYGKNAITNELAIERVFDDVQTLSSYPESNVIDNDVNYESRWSTSNESAVNLTIELETTSTVSSMDIAWGRGDKTVYEFEIYAREGTNGDWTKVYDNLSSGEANKLETFNLIDIEAKQIRIKSFGNDSGNGITDIKEVKIYGPGKL